MTEEDVRAIESRLGVTLPQEYSTFLLAYPQTLLDTTLDLGWKHEPPSERQFRNSPAAIIEYNEDARRDDGTPWTTDDGPWPHRWFIIGDDQCGNYWCVDLREEERGVWFYDHDTGEFTAQAPSLHAYAEWVLEEIRAFNEERAQRKATS
jgi:hypothetical protein